MAMTLVSTVTVGSGGAASISFSNIPQNGKDLLVVFSGRSDAGNVRDIRMTFNGSTTGYAFQRLAGTGGGTYVDSNASMGFALVANLGGTNTTSDTFSNSAIYISNYTSSANKSISSDSVYENDATTAWAMLLANRWSNSAAITSIAMQTEFDNFVQHTTASLYIIS